jgi:hypothetical protein
MIGNSRLLLVAAAFATTAAAAQQLDQKLWSGTWHLNSTASKWTAAGKEQSETRSYSFDGGKITMKSSVKTGAGKAMDFSYSAALDGKSYPMTGNPNADSITIKAMNAREASATSSLHGKTTVHTIATVSADGKHLTLKRTYVAMKGTPTEVLEFNR